MRACFSIAIVILLAAFTFACTGGPTGDYPADPESNYDAGLSQPGGGMNGPPVPGGTAGGSASLDAGAATGSLDAASNEQDAGPGQGACNPLADGGVGEASVDAQLVGGDAALDAGDSAAEAGAANDAQVDADANFPDAARDAQPALSDGSSDAPHMPCVVDASVP